jgi:TLD
MSSSDPPSLAHSAASSRSRTPQQPASPSPDPDLQSTASYFSYPVTRVVSSLYRRLTDPPGSLPGQQSRHAGNPRANSTSSAVFMPKRSASPFQPPPLTPLTLTSAVNVSHQLLNRTLAEEIRLLVPPRLQLVDTWRLAYSLERDGSSLTTLYENCRQYSDRSQRAGYVLVIRDSSEGALFGAYLTDPPHPFPHFYGTGECFLWRASVLASTPLIYGDGGPLQFITREQLEKAGLPLPPSADTTYAGRSTTLRPENALSANENRTGDLLAPPHENKGSSMMLASEGNGTSSRSGTSTPDRIRFKAFPYSGVNDYMIFCETRFLSVGGG